MLLEGHSVWVALPWVGGEQPLGHPMEQNVLLQVSAQREEKWTSTNYRLEQQHFLVEVVTQGQPQDPLIVLSSLGVCETP